MIDGEEKMVSPQRIRTKVPGSDLACKVAGLVVASSHILLFPKDNRKEFMDEEDVCPLSLKTQTTGLI